MHRLAAAAVAVVGSCAFVSSNLLVKTLAGALPSAEVGLVRAAGGLLLLAAVWQRLARLRRLPDPVWHLLRGLSGAGTITCLMYAFMTLPFALAVTVYYARVLLMIPLARLLLGERAAPGVWAAAFGGLAGVGVALFPSVILAGSWAGAAAVCAAAMLSSFSQVAVTRLTRSNDPAVIVGVFAVVAVIALIPPARTVWISPNAVDWPVLVGIALTGVLAQWLAAHAYRLGGTSFVAPFSYLEIPLAAAGGYAFAGEVPNNFQLIGGSMVISSAVYVTFRNTVQVRTVGIVGPGRDVSAELSTRTSQQT